MATLGVALGLGEDLLDRLGEGVEALLGLGLGRLDHQRLLDQQREVDGRRVEAEVEQALGEVEGGEAELPLHRLAGEDELVHAVAVEGDRQALAGAALGEAGLEVVGVQHRGLRGLGEAVGAEAEDVGVGADEDAEVALEAAQAADRLGPLEVEVEARPAAVVALAPHHLRPRQEGLDPLGDRDRPGAGAAAAVRLAEGLVQVDVDDVEAHVAGARVAHHRVEVGAVVVERPARLVDQRRRSRRCSRRRAPSVLGLVSIRQATWSGSSSIFARRSSISTPPRSLVATLTTS